VGLRYYAAYAVWCIEVPRCTPMAEEAHGRYHISADERGTNVRWLQGSQFLAAAEDEDAPPIDLAAI
jgi:hypothetical protein